MCRQFASTRMIFSSTETPSGARLGGSSCKTFTKDTAIEKMLLSKKNSGILGYSGGGRGRSEIESSSIGYCLRVARYYARPFRGRRRRVSLDEKGVHTEGRS